MLNLKPQKNILMKITLPLNQNKQATLKIKSSRIIQAKPIFTSFIFKQYTWSVYKTGTEGVKLLHIIAFSQRV